MLHRRLSILVSSILTSGNLAYYVDATSGNDSNTGLSPSQAWKTLSKVSGFTFTSVKTVKFKRGETWAEALTIPASGDNLTLDAYGSGALPIFEQGGVRATGVQCSGRTGLTFNNIQVQNATVSNINFDAGTHTVNNCVFDGSSDQNCQNQGTAIVTYNDCTITNAADDGFSVHASANVTAYRCIVTGNNQGLNFAVGSGVFTGYNCTFDNVTNDILPDPTSTVNLYRCLLKGMAGASTKSLQGPANLYYCIIVTKESVQTNTQISSSVDSARNLNLYNCTMYGWSGSNTRGGMTATGTSTITLTNCIADRLWRLGYIAAGAAINADYSNFNGLTIKSLTANTHEVSGNPLLVDPANDDFRLQAGSPARNAGTTYVGQPTTDFAGNAVQSPPSLGALEYV